VCESSAGGGDLKACHEGCMFSNHHSVAHAPNDNVQSRNEAGQHHWKVGRVSGGEGDSPV
jgi:hypothetical protein